MPALRCINLSDLASLSAYFMVLAASGFSRRTLNSSQFTFYAANLRNWSLLCSSSDILSTSSGPCVVLRDFTPIVGLLTCSFVTLVFPVNYGVDVVLREAHCKPVAIVKMTLNMIRPAYNKGRRGSLFRSLVRKFYLNEIIWSLSL